jgi:uncharacterized membrane protein YphA (DoxX/SURF4 family)
VNTVIWIAQAVLAVAMLGAGTMKLTQSKEKLLASGTMDWTEDFVAPQIKGIGLLEVLASLGLLLPGILDIAPLLTAVAAVGVALLMLGAAATHLRRGEKQMLPVNAALLAIAVFIAIERFGPHTL